MKLDDVEVAKMASVVSDAAMLFLAISGSEMTIQSMHDWIEEQRILAPINEREGSTFVMGLAFGFAIIDRFGGEWVQEIIDGVPVRGVSLHENLTVFPINKVRNQFIHGAEDSTLSFWEAIPTMLERATRGADPTTDIPLRGGGHMKTNAIPKETTN